MVWAHMIALTFHKVFHFTSHVLKHSYVKIHLIGMCSIRVIDNTNVIELYFKLLYTVAKSTLMHMIINTAVQDIHQ